MDDLSKTPKVDTELIVKSLLRKKFFHLKIDTKEEVMESPAFQLLSILSDHPMNIDELEQQFDTKGFILNILTKLRGYNLVNMEGDKFSLVDTSELNVEEKKVGSSPKIGKSSLTSQDIDGIDKAIRGNRQKRDRFMKDISAKERDDSQEISNDPDIDSLFDDVLGESIEDAVADFDQSEVIQSKDEAGLIQPLVKLLQNVGYIEEEQEGINEVVEYKIMKLITEKYPITTEIIEEELNLDSISLYLSNLKADKLIAQRNDYRWIISKETMNALKEYVDQRKDDTSSLSDEHMKIYLELIDDKKVSLKNLMHQLNYIKVEDRKSINYDQFPEYEILNILMTGGPLSNDDIKKRTDHTLPVMVSRMLSKLHVDGLLSRDVEERWNVAEKFYYLLSKPKLSERLDQKEIDSLAQKYDM